MKTKHERWIVFGAFAGGLALAAASWRPIVSNVEQPKYTVVETDGDFEIRDYAPMIVAEADVTGTREAAIREGFRTIADYIFGNNLLSQKIAMTAPVTQQAGEKIAMTAPPAQQGDSHTWHVRFVMPASYTMETLPKPKNPAVTLKEVQERRFAVIRFSGIAHHENWQRYTEQLRGFIKAKILNAISEPAYAFYNPPWTLPPLRRNEILIEISS
jgi:SOUL heme-binding protein